MTQRARLSPVRPVLTRASARAGTGPSRGAPRDRCPARRAQRGARPVRANHVARLFGDHDRRRVGVARRDRRHDRRVHDPQAGDAVHAQSRVDHAARIAGRSHPARADGMEDRRADVARGASERFFPLDRVRPGRNSSGSNGASAGAATIRRVRRSDVDRDAAVLVGRKVVRRDLRRLPRIAVVIWTLPRDVGRRLHTLAVKASNTCSGSPNLCSDSGCTWYSRSGRSPRRTNARTRPAAMATCTSARCAATRTRARSPSLPSTLPRPRVQRARVADLRDGAQLQMVLQILADAGKGCTTSMPQAASTSGCADAGELEKLRRIDRAGRQDHFLRRSHVVRCAALR